MGVCCSIPGPDLRLATKEEIEHFLENNYIPCVGLPSVDFKGDNEIKTLYVCEYENGCELTFAFLDEDRPNACEDFMYDTIRKPLFGRSSDIESIIIIKNEEVVFPGTHSLEQDWKTKNCAHGKCEIQFGNFEKHDDNGKWIVYINTWNHLMGEKNANSDMKMSYVNNTDAGIEFKKGCTDFEIRIGSRADVDSMFTGCMTSLAEILTEETIKKLGKRISPEAYALPVAAPESNEKAEPEATPEQAAPLEADEPKAEEPKAEEPKAEEPKVEEPKAEEPKAEEPKADEPKVEEPEEEEPKAEEPKAEEPKAEEPEAEEPEAVGKEATPAPAE